jgi:lysophospholipase L1-like esterase
MKWRRAARAVGRAALWLFIFLACAEVAARLVGWQLLRERAKKVEAQLPQGGYRMLFIGESTTYGLGVDPGEAYPATTAALLEVKYPERRFLAFNRGVPSLTTAAMLKTLPDKLALLHPDLVVLLVGVNDFHSQYNGVRVPGEGWLPRPLGDLLGSLRIYRMLDVWLQRRRPKMHLSEGSWLDERGPRGVSLGQAELFYDYGSGHYLLDSDDPRDMALAAKCRVKLRANLRKMLEVIRASGAKAVVLGYLRATEENGIVSAVARENGVPYIATWPEGGEPPKEMFQADGFHPSPLGHRVMAERIADGVAPLLGRK